MGKCLKLELLGYKTTLQFYYIPTDYVKIAIY